MSEYAQAKASTLLKYYDRITEIDVVMDASGGRVTAEMIVHAEHKNTFIGREEGTDWQVLIDLVRDKLERQLTRHKKRYRNRKHTGT